MMAVSLSSRSSSCSSGRGFGLRSSALETKPKSIGRRTALLSVRTRAAKADDVTRDLKTSRTTITITTVALLTAFVVALSSSAPGDVAKADGQVFGLTPKVLAPGKTVVLPERTSSADITREDARIVPHKAKENFLEGCKTITGEPCEGSPEWESAQQRGGKVGGENSA